MPTGFYKRTKPINRKYPHGEKPVNPKIPRDKDLRYKLTEDDISEIREMHKTGNYTHKDLSELFKVSTSTICYYVNESYRKLQMEKNKKHIPTNNPSKEYYERRKKLLGDNLKKYKALSARKKRGTLNNFIED